MSRKSQQQPPQPDLFVELNSSIRMSFQRIPAGTFRMGSRREYDAEEPVHTVRITQPFYMGTYPVTQREFAVWTACSDVEHKNGFPNKADHPAENMSWDEAERFCEWLSATGKLPAGFAATLPTEAQWEYACRAGTETEYYTGDGEAALLEAGWFNANSKSQTQAVGQKVANNFGLSDMHGNVWEWCRDVWDEDAYKKRVDDEPDPESITEDASEGTRRVLRGGSRGISARYCRAAIRFGRGSWFRDRVLGFRVCLVSGSQLQSDKQPT